MKKIIAYPFFIFFVFPNYLLAEDSQKFGRFSDGKPYRIDSSGVQLSDQLAELEVENRELRSKLAEYEHGAPKARLVEEKKSEDAFRHSKDLEDAKLKIETLSKSIFELQQSLNQKVAEVAKVKAESAGRQVKLNQLEGELSACLEKEPRQDSCISQNKELKVGIDDKVLSFAELEDRLSKDITAIEKLVYKRKSIQERVKRRYGESIARLSELTTASGVSLDSIRRESADINSKNRFHEIQRDLKELEHILNIDIRRLSKLAI